MVEVAWIVRTLLFIVVDVSGVEELCYIHSRSSPVPSIRFTLNFVVKYNVLIYVVRGLLSYPSTSPFLFPVLLLNYSKLVNGLIRGDTRFSITIYCVHSSSLYLAVSSTLCTGRMYWLQIREINSETTSLQVNQINCLGFYSLSVVCLEHNWLSSTM